MTIVGDTAPLQLLLDADTRIATVDPGFAAELGYEPDQLTDRPFSRVVSPHDLPGLGASLVSLINGREDVVTTRRDLLAADGQIVDALISIEARTNDDSGFLGFSIAVRFDRSTRFNPVLPDHLRRLEVAAALIDIDTTVVDTNVAWNQLFPAATPDADTPLGARGPTEQPRLIDLVTDADRPSFETELAAIVNNHSQSLRSEQRCDTAHGTVWCRLSITAFRSSQRAFAVTLEDISAEHLTNRVLMANEQLFRSLAESSPVGLARLAPDLSITYSNPSWRRLTGETNGSPHLDLNSVIHGDGRDRTIADVRARIADDSAEPVRARLAVESELPCWASLRVATVHDDELGVIGHVITIEDVTDLVRAHESRAQLAGVVESTTDLVGIADVTEGTLVYLNAAAQELFAPEGFTEGIPVMPLFAPDEWERYRDDVYPVLRRGETWTGEVTMVRHDGQHIRVLQTIAAEVDKTGELERASVLGRDVTHQRETLDELAYKATHDHLTGLPNRSLLIDHIELALARSQRDRTPLAVLFIDLDRFKIVNDTYGHEAGDNLLQQIADRMSDVLRPSDTVARLGGDEFVVLCEDIDGEQDAMTIAGRVRSAIEDDAIRIDGIDLDISASVGIAMSNGGSTRDPDTLLKRADAAMYRAKRSGRARTELFDDELRSRNQRRRQMTSQLERAIHDETMELHYQPIVDLRSGRVMGVEAFVRWEHPVSGMLYPSDFLPLALETDLIAPLDAFVVRRACAEAAQWCRSLGADAPPVHINLAGQSLLQADLPAILEFEIKASGLPPTCLNLELSEPFVMGNGEALKQRLALIRSTGIGLVIDDVGTGATALPRLGEYDLTMLKIDSTLTSGLTTDSATRDLVSGIAALGQALGLTIGAESVEDRDSIAVLRSVGAQVAQGHVFSRPVPAAKLEPLLSLRSTLARA